MQCQRVSLMISASAVVHQRHMIFIESDVVSLCYADSRGASEEAILTATSGVNSEVVSLNSESD